jgi:homoserine kinase type II
MPVATTISESDFPAILANYDLGEYRGFRPFANGAGQTTVLLETGLGKFVLRYYENRSEGHVDFEVRLADFLREKQFPVPSPIRNRTGAYVGTHRGKPLVIIEFVEGEHCRNPNDHFDAEHAALAAQAVAQLHCLTNGYDRDYFRNREAFDVAYCWRQFRRRHADLVETEQGRWFKAELDSLVFPPDMPKGLCHADLNFANFLFGHGEVAAVLDFDMSFHGFLVYDVASLIYWWAMPPMQGLRSERARFILAEYEKRRPLSEIEKAHVVDALKLIMLLGISWGDRAEIEGERQKFELLDEAALRRIGT